MSRETGTGDFTERHIANRSRLMGWSHRSRFGLARQLLEPYRSSVLLDYGSGDGTFLSLVHDLFPVRVGADIWDKQLEMCREKFATEPGLSFVHPREIGPEMEGRFGAVVCTEVLEHCPPDEMRTVLDDLNRLVSHDGVILISVPIEIGPSLVVKQSARWLAARRGLGPYRQDNEIYRATEFLKMFLAREGTAIERPIYWYGMYGHKGFNWRTLRAILADRFIIEQQHFSPIPILGGLINSQVWFVCRPKS